MKKLHHEKCAIEEDMQKKIVATWMEPKTRNVQCEKSAIREKVQHEKSATRKKDAIWRECKKGTTWNSGTQKMARHEKNAQQKV